MKSKNAFWSLWCCLVALFALSVSPTPANAQGPVLPDPCTQAYLDAMAAADAFEQDCLNTPIPGPLPCLDWPECCSQEAEIMRDKAWRNYLICIGVLPPANPQHPGTDCFAIYAAETDQIIANMILCMQTISVSVEACEQNAMNQINQAAARLRACLGLPPEENAAHNKQGANWQTGGRVSLIVSAYAANHLVALVEGVSDHEASTASQLQTYDPCTDPSPGYDEMINATPPNCSGFRYHDPVCYAPVLARYKKCINDAETAYRARMCICITYLYVDPTEYEQCKADALYLRDRAWNSCWAVFLDEAANCCVEVP